MNGRVAPRRGLIVTLLVGVPVLVLLVWPQALGLQRMPLVAQAVAFRSVLALGLGLAAVGVAVVAVRRRRWGVAAALAIVLTLASVGNGAIVLIRGSGGSLPPGELTVMVWNTQGGATSPAEVADVVLRVRADIVSLPEMDEDAAAEVARLVGEGRLEMTAATTRGDDDSWIPTSLLVAAALGTYVLDRSAGSTPGLPSGVWRPDGDGSAVEAPTIVAAHPTPPLRESMDDWRSGLQWLAARCDEPDVVLAGDLNATVDHLSGLGEGEGLLGGCRDAASLAGAGAVGTWPSTVPTWLASPIDHVLVGSSWRVLGFQVITDTRPGSDHRAVVAVLGRR